MARRFANFDWAIKHSGGTVGGELKEYLDFKTGNKKIVKTPTADGGASKLVGLKPFTVTMTGATALHQERVNARQTGRASVIGLTEAELGLVATAAEHEIYSIKPATISGGLMFEGQEKPSQITGRKYTPSVKDAFSIPFGKKTDTDLMGDRFKELVIIASGGSTSKGRISYTPERVRR